MDMEYQYQWEGASCPSKEVFDIELDCSQIKMMTDASSVRSIFEELSSRFNDSSLDINNIHFGIDTDSNSHIIKHKKIELKLIINDKQKTFQVLKSISSINDGTANAKGTINIYVTKINLITDSWIILVTSNELNTCSMIIIWKVSSDITNKNKSRLKFLLLTLTRF